MLFSLPNILTLLRIVAIAPIVVLFYVDGNWTNWTAFGLFAVAGCQKALMFGLEPLSAILIGVGMQTAIGNHQLFAARHQVQVMRTGAKAVKFGDPAIAILGIPDRDNAACMIEIIFGDVKEPAIIGIDRMTIKPTIFWAMQFCANFAGMTIKDQSIKPRTSFNSGHINMIGTKSDIMAATGQGLFKQDFARCVKRADIIVVIIPGAGGDIRCTVFNRWRAGCTRDIDR